MWRNFRAYYKSRDDTERDLPWREYLKFIPYWDILSGTADTLIIFGIYWTPDDEEVIQCHDPIVRIMS